MLSPLDELKSYHPSLSEPMVPVKVSALETLKAIYQNAEMPLHTRMRAAVAALPFESPKLAVTAVVTTQDFAERLEKAKARSDAVRLLPARPVEPAQSFKRRL